MTSIIISGQQYKGISNKTHFSYKVSTQTH